METIKENRNQYIDFIKAITIILVVIGHAVQGIFAPDNFDNNILFRYIYCFHMSCFMFISGFLSYKNESKIGINWLKKRALRLVVPFTVWFFIGWIIEGNYSFFSFRQAVIEVLKSPDNGGSWFLWVLFLCCVCLFMSNEAGKIIKKVSALNDKIIMIISMLLIIILVWIIWIASGMASILGIRLCAEYIIFFFCGYALNFSLTDKASLLLSVKKIALFSVPLYFLLAFVWHRTKFCIYADQVYGIFDKFGLDSIVATGLMFVYAYILMPFIGIGFMAGVSLAFAKKTAKLSRIIGSYTLEIYLLHGFFRNNYSGNAWIDSIISVLSGVVCSIVIAEIIEKNKVTGRIIFGRV